MSIELGHMTLMLMHTNAYVLNLYTHDIHYVRNIHVHDSHYIIYSYTA